MYEPHVFPLPRVHSVADNSHHPPLLLSFIPEILHAHPPHLPYHNRRRRSCFFALRDEPAKTARKKLAIITTEWRDRSHAWHMGERFLVGYPIKGKCIGRRLTSFPPTSTNFRRAT